MEGKVTYNWRELQTYFDCFGSPKEVMAKLDRVSVVMTQFFTTTTQDINYAAMDLKDSIDFLSQLRFAIGETINTSNKV